MKDNLYSGALALAAVLSEELEGEPSEVARRCVTGALALFDAIAATLALPTDLDHLHNADLELQVLRARIHLAFELDRIDDALAAELAEQMDGIGRQLGGLLRHRAAQAARA